MTWLLEQNEYFNLWYKQGMHIKYSKFVLVDHLNLGFTLPTKSEKISIPRIMNRQFIDKCIFEKVSAWFLMFYWVSMKTVVYVKYTLILDHVHLFWKKLTVIVSEKTRRNTKIWPLFISKQWTFLKNETKVLRVNDWLSASY